MESLQKNSEQLLLKMKMGENPQTLVDYFRNISIESIQSSITTDNQKKAFWINMYNAYFLILRKIQNLDKSKIYKSKSINIGGHLFTLDDLEHGILRKYRYKYSLGFLPSLFVPSIIKKLAVDKVDYRIHFALNCGAKSCPPIAFYYEDRIEQQLEMATISFLEGETEVKEASKEIWISRLFLWYLGDFGGKSGVRRILEEKLNISTSGYSIHHSEYNWEEDLSNFV
ncbi:MAG: DUF547 domain-containing protein [Bacteroidota bacterium]